MEYKDIVESAMYFTKIEYNDLIILIDKIINSKTKDENILSSIYDRILSLVFIGDNEIKSLFYKLNNYTKTFNKELSDDYENIFLEQFYQDNELDDNNIKKVKKQIDSKQNNCYNFVESSNYNFRLCKEVEVMSLIAFIN